MTTSALTDWQRLQRPEDMAEIEQLKARYAEALDHRSNGGKIAALFCEDGRCQVGEDPAPAAESQGHKGGGLRDRGWQHLVVHPSLLAVGHHDRRGRGDCSNRLLNPGLTDLEERGRRGRRLHVRRHVPGTVPQGRRLVVSIWWPPAEWSHPTRVVSSVRSCACGW